MTKDRKQIILGVVTGLAVLVAVGALAVALIALHKDQTLQVQVKKVDAAETQSQLSETTSRLGSLQERFEKVSKNVAGFVNCIPELQTEIGGLSINWKISPINASEDSFSIADGRQISRDCEDVIFGAREEPGK
jgi:hypothetical protein